MKAFLVLCLALPLMAQGRRPPMGWWDSPTVKDLNLTDDQTRTIRETVREYRARLIDQRAAAEKAEGDLEDLFNDGEVDQKRAGEAIDRLANARADLTRTMSQMSLRLRSVLTQDQWRELQRRAPLRRRAQGQAGPGDPDGAGTMMPKRGARSGGQQPPPPPQD